MPLFQQLNDTVQFELDGARYVACSSFQNTQGHPKVLAAADDSSLVTVIQCPAEGVLNFAWLEEHIDNQKQVDDVFNTAFLRGIIFTASDEPKNPILFQSKQLLDTWGTTLWTHIAGDTSKQPSPGLYLWKNESLWDVYKVYDDTNNTFVAGVYRCAKIGGGNKYANLRIGGESYQTLSVVIPSRSKAFSTLAGPLEGLRFAVKDLYRIEGLKNALCSRAYYDIDEPAKSTAPMIQQLIDSGAHLVGLNKLACLIAREEPTECVDYPGPFNPRGDGYQSPAGSSNGSAAAIASYDFLDFTIGSDRSARRPAFFNGCFALRPTHSKLLLDGMRTTFELFDMPSIFCRDIKTCKKVAIACFGQDQIKKVQERRKPLVIYPLDYLPTSNPEQMKLFDHFANDLATSLNTEVLKVSIAEFWNTNKPEEADGQTIDQFFDKVGDQTFLYEFYHNYQDFRDLYHEKYQKSPYINPFVTWRWNVGKSVTKSQRDRAIHKLGIYRKWFLREVLREETHESFIVLPIAEVAPNYRDTPPGPPFKENAFSALYLSPILGAPEFVVPIGQLPYDSRISGRVEQLPVAVSVLGLPGTDNNLMDVVECCLRETGRQTVVRTGKVMFEVDEKLLESV